ncbi:hypothetical protein D3C80_1122410 [compost metagenome]
MSRKARTSPICSPPAVMVGMGSVTGWPCWQVPRSFTRWLVTSALWSTVVTVGSGWVNSAPTTPV